MSETHQLVDGPLEVLDVLWECDGDSGARLPVNRADAVAKLRANGQDNAAALVARLPHADGVIDAAAVDQVFLSIHYELARLSEFLHVPHQMAAVLRPLIAKVREQTGRQEVVVIDVGCGIGLNLRYMAAHTMLGESVSYRGVDLNELLIGAARSLAQVEHIPVTFSVGNAFRMKSAIASPESTIVVSQGVLHHVAPHALATFFSHHEELGVAAFAHFDVNPGFWSNFGGWVLHQVRMREAISRHDGALSMARAFAASTLLTQAQAGLGNSYVLECDDRTTWYPAPHRALRPVVGVRR